MPQPKADKPDRLGLSKFIKKAPKHNKTKKEKNIYQFVGFYDRLKSIDVKVSHASLIDQSFMLDHLQNDEEKDDLSQSNLIAIIKAEKVNNATLEFRRVWKDLEHLAYSFPLVILNKNKIVTKLLEQLQDDTLKVVYPAIIELIIALIKDLRQDIYSDFMHDILPCVISILDCTNLTLLDAVFSLLSFSFKYLLTPLRDDLARFYNVYVELLLHKNKYVRKFAAQSFSYVLRKVKFTQEVVEMICSIQGEHEILGAVEILFEICSGETDQLHSKANEVLTAVLSNVQFMQKEEGKLMSRYLYLKLTNSIDTQKQMPMFEVLIDRLRESSVSLMGAVINDTIKLKFGKRVSQELGLYFLKALGEMIKQTSLCSNDQNLVAESLSLLYYFFHRLVRESKVFSAHLFSAPENVIFAFFKILQLDSKRITTETDIQITKVLEIKHSSTRIEFNKEGHQEKCLQLVKPLNKWTLKNLTVDRIALLVSIIQNSGQYLKIQVGGKCVDTLNQLIYSTSDEMSLYLICKFVSIVDDNHQFVKQLKLKIKAESIEFTCGFDFKENIVLNAYQKLDGLSMMQQCLTLIDLYNVQYQAHVQAVSQALLEEQVQLTVNNCQSIFILKQVVAQGQIPQQTDDLLQALTLNLSKNSRHLRIATLKVLQMFTPLDYLPATTESKLDGDTIKKFYVGTCPIISLLLKAEDCAISMETEKTKTNLLRKVQLIVASELVPPIYMQICYRYGIGCFWVKFTPLYQAAMDLISEVFKSKNFIQVHLKLIENLGYLLQIGGEDDDQIIKNMQTQIQLPLLKLAVTLFTQDITVEQDFVQIKDFYSNMIKSLYSCIDVVLSDVQLKNQLINSYLEFMEFEYRPLQFGRRTTSLSDFHSTVIASNKTDSQDFKAARRVSQIKLCCIYELFSKAQNLNKISTQQTMILIDDYMELIQTADDNLQKIVLSGLMKVSKKQDFQNKTLKLPKYIKLLEGLIDDNRFRDMIPVIAFGSTVEHEDQTNQDEESQIKVKKDTESIPKLAEEDRLEVLPVIVKVLFSKLLKKKGVVNNKSLHQRRTFVYQFFAGLDPITEFPIFFKELLQPLGLKIQVLDQSQIRQQLQLVSFSQFIQFIGSVEIIFSQLGSLLNRDDYLTSLTNILVIMLAQAKQFLGNMKEVDSKEEGLYQFVERQCRECVRKGLKIMKFLYSRFSYAEKYAKHLSTLFYGELLQDQIPYFRERYISDKAQLIELATIHWSLYYQQNYLKYPDVLPALMNMLLAGSKIESQVFQLHLGMVKNLVVASIDSDAERLRFIQASKKDELVDEMMDSDGEKSSNSEELGESVVQQNNCQIAQQIIRQNVQVICEGLHHFWTTHQTKLRQALVGTRRQQGVNFSKDQLKDSIAMTNAVRDLTFIMSELSTYLDHQSSESLVHSFLDMMVSLISQKHLLQSVSSYQQKSRLEELLMFGCQAITNLLTDKTDAKIQERISEMFLSMQSKKAREMLAKGLHKAYNTEVTRILVDLNTVKKGMADVDYDFDKVLGGIQTITKLEPSSGQNVLLYCVLSLLQHPEFSVREYSLHALSKMLTGLDERLFKMCESQILQTLKVIKDEMIMKTLLLALRTLVIQSSNLDFKSTSQDLRPLINEEHDDFFTQILSMQLPQRIKSLRKLQTVVIQPNTFARALLPLIDYLIFDMKNQMENRRNTIRYSRDQSNQLQEESLSVYTSYAQKLTWGQYMSLVRKLLYKIEKATRQQNGVAAQKEDSQNEKVITKCLCKVLEGFNFPQVPDAVALLQKTAEDKVHHKYEVVEYSDFLKKFVGTTIDEVTYNNDNHKDADLVDSDQEDGQDLDVEMNSDKVEEIQDKLLKKVLPLLQRHLTQTKGENTTIRSFVAVSIAKVIRKLPIDQFTLHLQKLINLIVIKGLRVKDLNTREKARKALIKVIGEVSPRFISLILQELGNNLNRGFQLHVYLYTVHYVFNYMKDQMKAGQITNQMINLISPLLLREMYGDLLEERKATEETAKKHIKESKARKAMPIYEVFAEFIDFKSSFLELIQPIVKVLEDNPTHSAIQMTEDLLARISNSVLKNTSITGPKLLPFIRQIIEKGVQMSMRLKINDEKAKRDYGAKPDSDYIMKSKQQKKLETHEVQIKWKKADQWASDRKTQEICGRVLANFGIQTLKKALNQKGLVLQGDEIEDRTSKTINQKSDLVLMLDPFVLPLLDSFKTFYNPIVIQTLQVMIHVIHLGLPSFKVLMKKFLNRIFKLFTTNTSADNDFANSLFKCVSELIRTYSVYNDLSELQIKTLVQIIKSNLQNYSTQSSVFTCLKAILYRKFQCADLYDLITNIQDMMVTSVQQSTRYTCAQIFITFVLEYPMEEKRLDIHIQHLLKNLTYFDAEGRQQLLETLLILIDKMPEQKIQTWTDLIFLTLFLRLVNESSTKCRDIVTQILKKLVTKSQKRYIDTVFQMQDDSSEVLTNGKLQLLSLMADCGKLQKQDIHRTVELLANILQKAAQNAIIVKTEEYSEDEDIATDKLQFLKGIGLDSDESEKQVDEDQEDSKWSNAYFSITCLENIYTKCNQSEQLTQALAKHPNLQSDLVTLMWKSHNYWVRLSCQRVIGFLLNQSSVEKLLGVPAKDEILKFTYKMLSVLNFPFVTEILCKQLVQNLTVILKSVADDDLVKVYKKASYIGRRILGDKSEQTSFKHQAILSFYKNSIPYLQQKQSFKLTCSAMLEFVYRTYTDEQLQANVRDPSIELVDQMSSTLNKDEFIQIFNAVQMQITQQRTERKMKEKVMVASEEGLVKLAQKRAKKIVKKKEKHKQKVLMNALTR